MTYRLRNCQVHLIILEFLYLYWVSGNKVTEVAKIWRYPKYMEHNQKFHFEHMYI